MSFLRQQILETSRTINKSLSSWCNKIRGKNTNETDRVKCDKEKKNTESETKTKTNYSHVLPLEAIKAVWSSVCSMFSTRSANSLLCAAIRIAMYLCSVQRQIKWLEYSKLFTSFVHQYKQQSTAWNRAGLRQFKWSVFSRFVYLVHSTTYHTILHCRDHFNFDLKRKRDEKKQTIQFSLWADLCLWKYLLFSVDRHKIDYKGCATNQSEFETTNGKDFYRIGIFRIGSARLK